MLMLADVWEGALDIDEPVLRSGGVVGLMIRLNDMNGGHHMDTNFYAQWDQAVNFLRAPYFVYNPWVDGEANFQWLANHVPAKTTVVFPDVEVKRAGYSPADYSAELNEFMIKVRARWQYAIYTGGWFLPLVDPWPSGNYWWARWPYYLCPQGDKVQWTWNEMQTRMNTFGYKPDPTTPKKCPGNPVVWQCSGDKVILPGTANRPMDINAWAGTLTALETWWGTKLPSEPDLETKVNLMWLYMKGQGWIQ